MPENSYNSTALQQLLDGNSIVSVTVGDSMRPLLQERRTHVVVEPVHSDLRSGDLPLYRRENGQLLIHRIIRVDHDAYYVRGDNRYGLERVPKGQIYGVVTTIFRNDRDISVNEPRYRAYVILWRLLYPLRWVYMILRRICKTV